MPWPGSVREGTVNMSWELNVEETPGVTYYDYNFYLPDNNGVGGRIHVSFSKMDDDRTMRDAVFVEVLGDTAVVGDVLFEGQFELKDQSEIDWIMRLTGFEAPVRAAGTLYASKADALHGLAARLTEALAFDRHSLATTLCEEYSRVYELPGPVATEKKEG